jgi:hypothetical protein
MADDPAIIQYGRTLVPNYSSIEYIECLIRAFKTNNANFITLDSHPINQRFVSACAAWAIDGGLLYNDRNEDDGQSVVSSFRLTDKGKEVIL